MPSQPAIISATPKLQSDAVAVSGSSSAAMGGLSARWESQPNWLKMLAVLALLALVSWADGITGWEVSLFVFYALPLSLAVWYFGFNVGLFSALICGAIWWYANRQESPYVTDLGYLLATANRLVYFIVVVLGVAAIRRKQEADAAHIRLLEDLRRLEHDIVHVSEHEQQRIGRDIHDGLCQQLAAVGCAIRVLAEDLDSTQHPAKDDAMRIETVLKQAVDEAKNMARGIFPVHVDCTGLAATLEELADTTSKLTGIEVRLSFNDELKVGDPDMAMHLYRIAQESISNAVKHSGASQILISLSSTPNTLVMSIKDNGMGFDEATASHSQGMGLRTLRYRTQVMGGHLDVACRKGDGCTITCTVPLPPTPPLK